MTSTPATASAGASPSSARPPWSPWTTAEPRSTAADLGIDPARIGLAGDSAGGHLAAAAALRLAATGQEPTTLVLIYAALDLHDEPGQPEMLTRVMALYAGDHDRDDPEISPLTAPDLGDLPPAIVAAAEHDPLRRQAERFAEGLCAAGVNVRHLPGTGLQHGFLGQLGTHPFADQYLADIGAVVAAVRGSHRI